MKHCVPVAIAVLLAIASAAPLRVRAGACASPGWEAAVIPSEAIAQDGGLLVMLGQGFGGSDAVPTVQAELRRAARSIALTRQDIGPGIWRLAPSEPVEAGTWTLRIAEREREMQVVAGQASPVAAPVVRRVESEEGRESSRRGGTRWYQTVTADLRGAPPSGTFGVLVESDGAPILFAQTDRSRSLLLYSTPGRCQLSVPGARPPSDGQEVTLRFVDAQGRLSERSRPVVVRRTRPTENPLTGL